MTVKDVEQKLWILHQERIPEVWEHDRDSWATAQRLVWTQKHDLLMKEWILAKYKDEKTQENPFPWCNSFMNQEIFFAGHWDLLPTAVVREQIASWKNPNRPVCPHGAIKTCEDTMMYLYAKNRNWLKNMRIEWANLHDLS